MINRDLLLIQMARDPLFFSAVFFQEYMEYPSGWFHREWMDMLNSDWENICIVAPRGIAKTTNIDFIWVLWNLIFTDHHFVVAISNTFDKAKQMILQPIKDAVENNELFKDFFGDMRGDRWTATELEFRIPDGKGGEERKKLDIAGVGQSIRGMRYLQYRPDIIIADDIEDDEQIKSASRRKEIKDWFWKQVYHAMRKDNSNVLDGSSYACKPKKIVVGTILHQDSFLNNILDMVEEDKKHNIKPVWLAKKYSIIYTDKDGVRRALWAERDTIASLDAERQEAKRNGQESSWVQEKMNEVMAEEDKPININCIQFHDDIDVEKLQLSYYIAMDLALSAGSKPSNERDYNVVMCLGLDMSSGNMYVMEYKKYQTNDVNLTVNKAMDMATDYYAKKIIFEKGSFQGSIEVLLQQEMKKRGDYFKIEGKSHGNMRKEDRIRMTVAFYANRKKIYIHSDMKDLYDEMYEFPSSKHDDILDALTYAIVGADPKFVNFKDYAKGRQHKEKSILQQVIDERDNPKKTSKSPYKYI